MADRDWFEGLVAFILMYYVLWYSGLVLCDV